MINEDLLVEIQSRYQRGHKSAEIKRDLIKIGWSEKEVDDAISYLHRLALKQVPIISSVLNLWEGFELKVANISPRMAVVVLASIAVVIALLGVGMYVLLDPLNIKSGNRDEQRNAALTQIQSALDNYFSQRQSYPTSLSELSPEYLQSIPKDPRTREEYEYRLSNGNYELCVKFEIKPVECFSGSSRSDSSLIDTETVVPEVSEAMESFSINGLVFMDKNNDKVQQADEAVNSSVLVHVAGSEGNEICQELTDAKGTFSCGLQKGGVYYVFIDATSTLEVLGVNPQKVTVPGSGSTDGSAEVILRTKVISTASTPQ